MNSSRGGNRGRVTGIGALMEGSLLVFIRLLFERASASKASLSEVAIDIKMTVELL